MMVGRSGSKAKGSPKLRRMGKEALKVRRSMSWRRGQARKAARREAQAAREAANRLRRAAGVPTPWEAAKAAAGARREQRATENLARMENTYRGSGL